MEMILLLACGAFAKDMLLFLLQVVAATICTTYEVRDAHGCRQLDQFMSKGMCAARRPGSNLAADGFQCRRVGAMLAFGYKATERTAQGPSVVYKIAVLGKCGAISQIITGSADDMVVRFVECPHAFRTETTEARISLKWLDPAYNTKQIKLAAMIADQYTASGYHASALITGPPGTGKSCVADLVATRLKQPGCEPVIVKGYNFGMQGCTLSDIIWTPTESNPVILLVDEYDASVLRAESGSEAGEASSLAKNRSTLLSALDRLSRTSYLILIATTNQEPAWFAGPHQAYARAGRFDQIAILDKSD